MADLTQALMNVPVLRSMLGMQQYEQGRQAQDLANRINTLNAAQKLADLQMLPQTQEMNQLKLEQARMGLEQARAHEAALQAIPEHLRPWARIAPPQTAAGQFRNPYEGMPEIGKLQVLKQKLESSGNPGDLERAKEVGSLIQMRTNPAFIQRRNALIQQGVPEHVADGISLGVYRMVTDSQGGTHIVDLRGQPVWAFPSGAVPQTGVAPGAVQAPAQVPGQVPAQAAPQAPLRAPPQAPYANAGVAAPGWGEISSNPYAPPQTAPGVRTLISPTKPAKQINDEANDLGKFLNEKKVPQLEASARIVEEILHRYPVGKLPGIGLGLTESTTAGIYYGVRTALGSREAAEASYVRAALKDNLNAIVQQSAGLAQTITETENLRRAMLMSPGEGAELNVRNAYARWRERFEETRTAMLAQADPRAAAMWYHRQGQPLRLQVPNAEAAERLSLQLNYGLGISRVEIHPPRDYGNVGDAMKKGKISTPNATPTERPPIESFDR